MDEAIAIFAAVAVATAELSFWRRHPVFFLCCASNRRATRKCPQASYDITLDLYDKYVWCKAINARADRYHSAANAGRQEWTRRMNVPKA
jgi:hypothetical protein